MIFNLPDKSEHSNFLLAFNSYSSIFGNLKKLKNAINSFTKISWKKPSHTNWSEVFNACDVIHSFFIPSFPTKKEFEYQVEQFKSGNLDILQFKRWVLSLNQELEEELTVYKGRLYEADGELSAETAKLYGTFLISSRTNRFDNTLKQIARLPCFEKLVHELFKWMATIQ